MTASTAPMRIGRRTTVGAEIDGALLRVVLLDGRRVLDYRCLAADDPRRVPELLRGVLRRRTTGAVAWASPGLIIRRAPFPGHPDRRLVPVARDVLDRHLPGGGHLPGAGVVQPIDGRSLATFGAITAEAAGGVGETLGRSRCRLVIAPFTLVHDGLYLAVRHSCAEITLVVSGVAVATRQLRVGGLMAETSIAMVAVDDADGGADPDAGHLGDPAALPPPEASAFARRAPRVRRRTATPGVHVQPVLIRAAAGDFRDPDVMAATRRYVAGLAREVHRTVEHWERGGERCPRTLWVYGPGARLPHLPSFMNGLGYTAAPPPVAPDLDYSAIDDEYRLEAYGAITAALHPGPVQPLAQLDGVRGGALAAIGSRVGAPRARPAVPAPDPLAGFEGIVTSSGSRAFSSPLVWQQRDTATPRGLGLVAVAVLLLALVGGGVWWNAGRALTEERAQRARAERVLETRRAEVAAAERTVAEAAAVRGLGAGSVTGWTEAMSALLEYLPGDPVVESVVLDGDGPGVVATISTPAETTDVARWRTDLALTGAVVDAEATDGRVVFTLVFPVAVPESTGAEES